MCINQIDLCIVALIDNAGTPSEPVIFTSLKWLTAILLSSLCGFSIGFPAFFPTGRNFAYNKFPELFGPLVYLLFNFDESFTIPIFNKSNFFRVVESFSYFPCGAVKIFDVSFRRR